MDAYSIHLDGETDCEAEKFYKRFEYNRRFREDMQLITQVIEELMARGAREGRFRAERSVHAIPIETSDLRLYCIRVNNNCVIFGNGGEKTSQRTQDSPDCYRHWDLLERFEKEFTRKIKDRELGWDRNGRIIEKMNAGVHFEFGDCE